jgi:hypothetical protein
MGAAGEPRRSAADGGRPASAALAANGVRSVAAPCRAAGGRDRSPSSHSAVAPPPPREADDATQSTPARRRACKGVSQSGSYLPTAAGERNDGGSSRRGSTSLLNPTQQPKQRPRTRSSSDNAGVDDTRRARLTTDSFSRSGGGDSLRSSNRGSGGGRSGQLQGHVAALGRSMFDGSCAQSMTSEQQELLDVMRDVAARIIQLRWRAHRQQRDPLAGGTRHTAGPQAGSCGGRNSGGVRDEEGNREAASGALQFRGTEEAAAAAAAAATGLQGSSQPAARAAALALIGLQQSWEPAQPQNAWREGGEERAQEVIASEGKVPAPAAAAGFEPGVEAEAEAQAASPLPGRDGEEEGPRLERAASPDVRGLHKRQGPHGRGCGISARRLSPLVCRSDGQVLLPRRQLPPLGEGKRPAAGAAAAAAQGPAQQPLLPLPAQSRGGSCVEAGGSSTSNSSTTEDASAQDGCTASGLVAQEGSSGVCSGNNSSPAASLDSVESPSNQLLLSLMLATTEAGQRPIHSGTKPAADPSGLQQAPLAVPSVDTAKLPALPQQAGLLATPGGSDATGGGPAPAGDAAAAKLLSLLGYLDEVEQEAEGEVMSTAGGTTVRGSLRCSRAQLQAIGNMGRSLAGACLAVAGERACSSAGGAGGGGDGGNRSAALVESVFEGVRARLARLQDEVAARDAWLAEAEEQAEAAAAAHALALDAAAARSAEAVVAARAEGEAAAARQLAFIDRLMADKDELACALAAAGEAAQVRPGLHLGVRLFDGLPPHACVLECARSRPNVFMHASARLLPSVLCRR